MSVVLSHNDIRNRFWKSIAVLMGICYLINPLNQQLYNVLHTISHGLNAPTEVMEHKIIAFDHSRTHDSFSHRKHQMTHEHNLIDFVQTLFEASQNQGQTTDPNAPKFSIDKHITAYSQYNKLAKLYKLKESFSFTVDNVHGGYTTLWLEPPTHNLL